MLKTVIGVFDAKIQAERAVHALREDGFDKEISIVAREVDHQGVGGESGGKHHQPGKEENRGGEYNSTQNSFFGSNDSVWDGTATGGVIGGVAGLIAGAGALAIPGIGPILAAGPLAGLLSGAVTGGIAGGLVDWGIPAEEGKRYEENIKEGKILVAVNCNDSKVDQAAGTLRRHGAEVVGTHDAKDK